MDGKRRMEWRGGEKEAYLNDNHVIRVLTLLVEDRVGGHHVVDDVALRDLLRPELLGCRQVLAVVVAQVVVADDGGELETRRDEEVGEDGLDLGLTSLEVISTNVDVVLQGEVENTRNKGVLRRAVDVWHSFENARHGEDCGWGNLGLTLLDGLEEIGGGVVDSRDNVSQISKKNGKRVENGERGDRRGCKRYWRSAQCWQTT